MAKVQSKNNPEARGPRSGPKELDGKKLKPVLYVGTAVGHGRYIAAQDEAGNLMKDRTGRPIAYRDI